MKQNIKLALAELEQEMEVIQKQDLEKYKGGSSGGYAPPSDSNGNDCLFHVLSHLSNGKYSVEYFEGLYNSMNRCGSYGGRCAEDGFVGTFSQMRELISREFIVGNENWTPEQARANGYEVILIYDIDGNRPQTELHAVVYNGITSSGSHYKYHDPQSVALGDSTGAGKVSVSYKKKFFYVKKKP